MERSHDRNSLRRKGLGHRGGPTPNHPEPYYISHPNHFRRPYANGRDGRVVSFRRMAEWRGYGRTDGVRLRTGSIGSRFG